MEQYIAFDSHKRYTLAGREPADGGPSREQRIPGSDYADLLKATSGLTRNHQDVLRTFRRMVFNLAAPNGDDHAKNFAFIMDDEGQWSLSPAYDLTYAPGPGGEHTMTVHGEGCNPTAKHCMNLARQFSIRGKDAQGIIEQVKDAVGRWPHFADEGGCTRKTAAKALASVTPPGDRLSANQQESPRSQTKETAEVDL